MMPKIDDAKKQFRMGKITKGEHFRLVKNLNDMGNILASLKFAKPYSYKKLDEIRRINLSVNQFYDEGDYDTVFAEIVKTNNELCKVVKERDRKSLVDFKRAFDHLSNFYKFRIAKAEINEDGELSFRDKDFDNVRCLLGNYLNVRYNFNKIEFETAEISDEYQSKIDSCMSIIESDSYSEAVKSIYSNIGRLISKMAKAEVVTKALEEIMQLCGQQEFLNIKVRAKMLIEKYSKIYDETKKKYNLVIEHLQTKTAKITAVISSSDTDNINPEMDDANKTL